MTKSIQNILLEHNIHDPEVARKISLLIQRGVKASKQFGKRCVILPENREEQVYDMFLAFVKDYVESDGSAFAAQHLMEFNERYGFYERKNV